MNAGPSRTSARKLDGVQALRAFAAMMVVFGHVTGQAEAHPERFGPFPVLRYAGGTGVDIFFLISGFIMVFASRRMFGSVAGAKDFAVRRLVRIVPPYWAATALMLAMLSLKHGGAPSLGAITATLGFFPFDTVGRNDGYAFPILDLGWTLNYEMMFYVIFALFLPFGRLRCVVGVGVAMLVLVAVGALMEPATIQLRFWTQPIILEFVAGMAVALAYAAGRLEFGPKMRLLFVLLGVAWYYGDPLTLMGRVTTPNDMSRVLGWGVCATLLLVAVVSGPLVFRSRPALLLTLLGDASYVLYLLHPFVLIVMLRMFHHPVLPGAGTGIIFVAATIVAACVVAISAHVWVERPVVAWLTRKLKRGGVPIGDAPLPPQTSMDAVIGGASPDKAH